MTEAPHLVVVGASLAGLRAVEAARKSGFAGRVTLIGAEPHLPYDRPPLSKAYLEAYDGDTGPTSTTFRTRRHLAVDLGVNLLLGAPAAALNTANRTVEIEDGHVIDYSALVIATGATARTLPGVGSLAGVHTLRTLDDADAVRRGLDERARVVVIGAGFIGSEVAAGARKRGLEPIVVEALPTPLVRAVGEQMGAALADLHRRNGTDLRCGAGVVAIRGHERVEEVILDDGSILATDLVVVGTGADPATEWLQGSGIALNNGVVCDATLSTGVEGVYAAGDIARWHNPTFDRPMRLEHWTSAAEQGALAALNALDPAHAKTYATVPYFWSDWYDTRIQFVGSPQADEIVVVDGNPKTDGRMVALYREGNRLVGALTLNGRAEIMKYRALITRAAAWTDALSFAATRYPASTPSHRRSAPLRGGAG